MTTEQMTTEQLTAIVAATADAAVTLTGGGYLDWSVRTDDDGGRELEVGTADGTAVQVDLSAGDLRALLHHLAATLLAEA